MFFSDGADAGAGIDPGGAGFLTIFGSDAGDSPSDTSPETDSQDGATTADAFAPDETADEQDLSAADVVAEQFAASLAEDGIELEPGDEPDDTDTDEGPIDFENLSPEELQALAKEFQEFKAQQAESTNEAHKETVRQAVKTAEDAAVAQVEQTFEQAWQRDVLAVSTSQFNADLSKHVVALVRASRNQDDPEAYMTQRVLAAAHDLMAKKEAWERRNADAWGPALEQQRADARLMARQHVPELREFYARALVEKYDLPPEVVADIAHPQRHIDAFEHRAKELVDMAAHAAAKARKQTQSKRHDANKALQGKAVRTSSTGRLPGGKPADLKGSTEELVGILATFR